MAIRAPDGANNRKIEKGRKVSTRCNGSLKDVNRSGARELARPNIGTRKKNGGVLVARPTTC